MLYIHFQLSTLQLHVIFFFPLKSCMLPIVICLSHQSSHKQLAGGERAEELSYEKFQTHAKTARIGQCASTYPSSRFNNIKNLPHWYHLPLLLCGSLLGKSHTSGPLQHTPLEKMGIFLHNYNVTSTIKILPIIPLFHLLPSS